MSIHRTTPGALALILHAAGAASLLVLAQLASADDGAEPSGQQPDPDQVKRLVAEAWKEPPDPIDVVVYGRRSPRPRPEEEIRSAVEYVYSATDDASPVRHDAQARQKEIDDEVSRIMREQSREIHLKKRIRRKGHLYREDMTKARDGVPLGPDTDYTRTLVNAGDPDAGDFTSFDFDHRRKIATIYDAKNSRWKQTRIWYAKSPSITAITLLRSLTANVSQRADGGVDLSPDPDKTAQLAAGENPYVQIFVRDTTYAGQPVHRFEFHSRTDPQTRTLVLLCDATDYSRVYVSETYDPTTGALGMIEKRNDFDELGFPRQWVREKHNEDGTIDTEEYVVEKVDLAPKLSDELFRFSPSADYAQVDQRFDPPVVTQPHEHTPEETTAAESPRRRLWSAGLLTLVITALIACAIYVARR
ncbi:hypothetical protein [Maioricimonas sp. JC845]|uniref:hypothetical protein n=1 Tax=Maioricimonas sp. JC845 TaxID=3232138 RepID=UPI00345A3485